MAWFFLFFLISGFCSILYEIIWLRLAMAQFGVTSALVSIVLSMFMAGLGLGSWAAGRAIRRFGGRGKLPALRLYALTELLIGVSAVLVPLQLLWGGRLLRQAGLSSSSAYCLASGIWIALTLVPWCACMGATIPVAMLAIRNSFQQESQRSFSFLYLANVLGAVLGATLPLLLIELYGFHGTLRIGAALNLLLAASAIALSVKLPSASSAAAATLGALPKPIPANRKLLWLLFATGLTSMGMEVVWIRQFTPYLGTAVYTFASILGLYLAATFVGSRVYRRLSRNHAGRESSLAWVCLALFALLPLVTADPRFNFPKLLRLVLGIAPFSATLGFVTPMLVDLWSGGDPDKAGTAYAANVLGCIVGPLLSGFLLLPLISERWVLFLFSLPWLLIGVLPDWSLLGKKENAQSAGRHPARYAVAFLALVLLFSSKDYEAHFAEHAVLRDNTATVIAADDGRGKQLFVNGVGMTTLSSVTKMMAHLPLTLLDHPPQRALAICFGMGTTFRSLLSWDIPTTVVELVPSVPRMFWYFHPDGPQLLQSPLAHVVIDDGRRYLERTSEQFDVITVDPPPPIQSAGSSLLYSTEFYAAVKPRLRTAGLLQQWLPTGDAVVRAAVARALQQSFPYVRVFRVPYPYGKEDWSFLFLASDAPIFGRTPAEMAQRLPPRAAADLLEWSPQSTAEHEFSAWIAQEWSLNQMIAEAPRAPALEDDRPENEYYILRRGRSAKNRR